ncbi:MAG: ATP-binding cassette domain-containing protein [Clostridiales bacterium]|jgi:ABC-2 type transport system ATP-binding protein|nr:ATP-binding cassette domain-containing protein [Clostridiales bacterium]
MIEVSHLTKKYGDKRGVDNISFKINEGEIVGFLGPNGAGKTTTMNIITGYLSATSGVAKVADIDVLEDPIAAKKHIGYLPEHPPLYLDMKVSEYLDFVYELKRADTPNRNDHISEICELVGISEVYNRVCKNLSKGYRQRVGLAQALIGNPEVLILDEPTVGLDPRQIVEIRNVIKELGKRRTIILSTHILSEVEQICERVLVIDKGIIIADDTPEDLAAHVSGEHKLAVRIAGPQRNIIQTLRSIDGIRQVTPLANREKDAFDFLVESHPKIDVRKPMFNALAKAGYPLLMVRPHDMSLEDIFISLTENEPAHDDLKGV